MRPLVVTALVLASLPSVLSLIALVSDWLESSRIGDWVRRHENRLR